MTLWQAVSERYDQLVTAFDAGRADAATRERMSALIHGRLDAGALSGAGLAVSLVDACRLSDALAAQLRARLSFDPRAADGAARVAALRAGMERLRELAKAEPGELGVVHRLTARVDDLAEAAQRGADIGDRLGALEADAALAERDLIVSTANRGHRAREAAERARATAARSAADRRAAQESARLAAERAAADLAADRVRAMNEVATLEHREATLHALAERCVAEIARPPRLAVPDPMALGPVPDDADGVAAFLRRLADVVRAMDVVEQAYGRPLAERDELTGMLGGYATMARRRGVDAVPAVASAAAAALAAVRALPCDVELARERVVAYQRLAQATPAPAKPPPASSRPAGPAAQPGATHEPAALHPARMHRGHPRRLLRRLRHPGGGRRRGVRGRVERGPGGRRGGCPTGAAGTSRRPDPASFAGSASPVSASPSARSSVTSSSNRLASAPIGSARAKGTRATRKVGTGSTRLRRSRLGAGLTTVPPIPEIDPNVAIMKHPMVPEDKRYCPSCGKPVGRSRDGQPGRTNGFCPNCRTPFDFAPKLQAGDLVGSQYEVAGCLAHGGLGWIYLAQDKNVSDRWVVLKGLLNSGDPDAYAAAVAERRSWPRSSTRSSSRSTTSSCTRAPATSSWSTSAAPR